jgi:signal transduction histidine kinase
MNQQLQNILDIVQQNENLSADEKTALIKAIKKADSDFTISEFKLERTEKVKRITGILLEETIEELEQKRKAVEAQNRELEIEAALEKVRSRTMAMQHSDELAETSFLLDSQVRALGIKTWGCAFNIYQEKDSIEWFGNEAGILPTYTVPRKGIFKKYYESGQKGNSIFVQEITGKECIAHYEFMSTLPVIGDVLKQLKETNGSFPDYQIDHVVYFKYGYLLFITLESVPEAHDIFKRFAKVFEQTYTRFLDLQKAEAQAKEAQIEAALEKVRNRTMAMQQSSDLTIASNMLYQELQNLDIRTYSTGYCIWDDSNMQSATFWLSSEGNLQPPFSAPLKGDPIFSRYKKAFEEGVGFYADAYSGEKLENHYANIYELPDVKAMFEMVTEGKMELPTIPKSQVNHVVYFKQGFLLFVTKQPIPEAHDIFKRFGQVFEQTYTRFLDLQKAEERIRESQIETALEKIRSRSLAMHKTIELKDVISLVFEKLRALDVAMDSACILTFNQVAKGHTVWAANPDLFSVLSTYVPYHDNPINKAIYDLRENGEDFMDETWTFEEKNMMYDYFFEHTDWKHFPDDMKQMVFNFEGWGMTGPLLKHSATLLVSYSQKTYSEHEIEIIKRFGNVFEQAYIRFLDLQKAEAQAREAEIETALERVRSRTMGMQKSEELSAVIQVVYEQLIELNFDIDGAGFAVDHRESDDWNVWQTDGFVPHPYQLHMPYFDHPMANAIIKAKKDGLELLVLSLTFEEKNKLIDEFFKYITQPKEVKKALYSFPGYVMSKVLLKNVDLYVSRYSGIPFTNAENAILIRFTKVFEQTYTRFNDLKQAEEQEYEARIEASLERIRSRSMSMQKSKELHAVIQVIFDQLIQLEFNIDSAGFAIDFRESDDWNLWIADRINPSATQIHIPYFDHPMPNAIIEAKKSGQELLMINLTFEEKNELYEHSFKHVKTPKKIQNEIFSYPGYVISKVLLDNVDLYMTNFAGDLYTDEENATLWRFGKVFEQAYIRFNDLKNAEERAKEVLKQSSIDRLRAKIASMRTATDLEQIIPSIWKELDILGVPFIRCGVFIMNDENQSISTYLSSPNGKALAAFELAYDTNEIAKNIASNWKKKKIYQTSWNKKEFLAFMADLIDKGLLKDPKSYQGAEQPPEHLYLNFAPFKQGMIYVGNVETLTADELDLVQSIANAFSIAYARYEDFNQLEKAKKSVDDSLTELKATQAQLIQSEKMASLGELTAGIAHEIQNPLNFVNNFSEVSNELIDEMKEEIDSGNYDEVTEIANIVKLNLEKINHHGKRADAIVKGMLQHSRSGSTTKELTDINKLADEYLRLAYHGLRAKDKTFNATLNTDFDEAIGSINVLPQDIGRVILNLITNAFYTVHKKKILNPENYEPTVTVKTKNSGNKVEVQVTDNGNGIPNQVLEKIFQPFFTTKPTGEGTGLGLSLSYDIVKAHGGELQVETKEGEGSTFSIIMPIT